MITSRRKLLTGLLGIMAVGAAPAIVRSGLIMPINPKLVWVKPSLVISGDHGFSEVEVIGEDLDGNRIGQLLQVNGNSPIPYTAPFAKVHRVIPMQTAKAMWVEGGVKVVDRTAGPFSERSKQIYQASPVWLFS